jgi:hypothetical protein
MITNKIEEYIFVFKQKHITKHHETHERGIRLYV